MKKLALLTASLAVIATSAMAQTTTAPATRAQSTTTVGTAPAEAKFSTVAPGEMFSSKLKGLNVYNQQDESVGEISDLAIKNNQIDALILSVGGFLGMGEHYVAVSPASVSIAYDSKNNKWRATMNTTKEALKAAPEFKYPK
ncbi:MAG: photosystem reaction center subunit H [Rhizobiales bacterium 62-47]|nr:PRC-barrel domain-containing protein [Hyphomicrobiales bacterium]OJY10171.1 MAG: photosystem reaction center subunit H [Rhizobiales bacterium 62-47]